MFFYVTGDATGRCDAFERRLEAVYSFAWCGIPGIRIECRRTYTPATPVIVLTSGTIRCWLTVERARMSRGWRGAAGCGMGGILPSDELVVASGVFEFTGSSL